MSVAYAEFGTEDRQTNNQFEVKCVTRQGGLIAELPNASVDELTWELNGTNIGRISMPTDDPRTAQVALAKTELQVWMEDELEMWLVPWRVAGNHQRLTFECEGLLSYFTKRFLTYTSLDYTNMDQAVIAWNLLSHAQADVDENLHIVAGAFTNTGKVRSRRYERAEHPNILDLLNEFPTLQDGFDFEIVTYGDGRREWWPRYPRKGQLRENLVLEWGRNIVSYEYSEDALNMANLVYCTGGQSGEVKLENNFRDAAAAAEYGEMQAVVSEGAQLDVNWLLERAEREVRERKTPLVVPTITVKNIEGVEVVRTLKDGDTVPVWIDHGRVNVNGIFRIQSKTWLPDNTARLTLMPEVV